MFYISVCVCGGGGSQSVGDRHTEREIWSDRQRDRDRQTEKVIEIKRNRKGQIDRERDTYLQRETDRTEREKNLQRLREAE